MLALDYYTVDHCNMVVPVVDCNLAGTCRFVAFVAVARAIEWLSLIRMSC